MGTLRFNTVGSKDGEILKRRVVETQSNRRAEKDLENARIERFDPDTGGAALSQCQPAKGRDEPVL